ncbi:TPA: hypothetical protein ACGD96_003068 [Salmonella enterica]|uniref:Uncharacterized protein n=6 Tax=Gammaproteobacteria TaxID=1236 RepID=C6G9S5_ECOLX|nr:MULTISPECIES: hypothetical protein [Gammaproteobacteria]AZT48820.1 hypothetical protein ELZ82_23775 [Salmonella enterica subsp. enterica serovar Mikawasima]EAU5125968.1 hypothetical protein [Salmonella enterica subsp. enterica serovar Infantis]EBV5179584.1 hypothetical protein [Salmonella enterica subsp. enterica serovar Carmel]ECE0367640.1 hypothetical protein [Salmonella enterica subsp. enterica]EDI3226243.1 hypothetical protein [Salmonella enterica subsp. enterica serovar Newport]EEJ225
MYKSLEELMAGIYEMAAPHGIICNEVSKFLAANQVKPEDISSGIWFFLWLKSAPKDAKPIQKEIPGFGVVLNMPTYGGTLNEAITKLIENECRQIQFAEGHPSLEAWLELVLAGRDDEEENEAAASIVDLLNGCHDLLDTAIINYLSKVGKINEQEILSLIYYGELCDHSLFGTQFSTLHIPSENNIHENNIIPIKKGAR